MGDFIIQIVVFIIQMGTFSLYKAILNMQTGLSENYQTFRIFVLQ
jgi:hypothetical protein